MSHDLGEVVREVRFTPVGDWLERYDQNDEEHCPARIVMELVRRRLAVPDDELGGYKLTPLGLNVAQQLRDCAA